MRSFFIFLTSFISLSSCLRLDDNLYNAKKISRYELDQYQGEKDFILPASAQIADSLIHVFTLSSKTASENSPTTIYAIYIGDVKRIATDTVIMYCHGNKWHMDFYWQRAKLLANVGSKNRFGVLMIDYRGYGMSEGKPSEEGMYTDVNTALTWLKTNGLTDNRLAIYGFSMGTASATKLSAEPRALKPNWLILEAPFASAETMVQDATKLAISGSYVTDLKIDNAEEIKKVSQPFLWLHGINDSFLNIKTHGEVVFKNYAGPKAKALRVPFAAHGNIPLILGFEYYKKTIEDFISQP
jgi:pimeloyl-ACP methyl ester carboxylesterase